MRILLVEDEDDLAFAMTVALNAQGFLVDTAGAVDEARTALQLILYSAVILDRTLPDGDGLDLLPSIRSLAARPGVLVLSAPGEPEETISRLTAGTDDYLSKPVETVELVARLQALFRRRAPSEKRIVAVGGLAYDIILREASVHGLPLRLPRRERLLLDALIRRAERVVSREHLHEAVFDSGEDVSAEAIKAHISRLRRRLTERQADVRIIALRGAGYMMREE